eukprot:CAMPEP_0114575148 /NCGR_PEP_ID=MMETSP0125-20121206/53_1 /TAXON_ID=485358 ORGANISM="Aristerostoma sp., Strain ATCC 50986" /NCGR_SAMPLE_ID=MMETSP0125 /ASSEMBLY_ACC=CAM_ASM_000245 /LENGTH=69 /DNA_ID=CAMNT_0001762659 /DNA_START=2153 /DNA_END=2362 /DNA_ORIENTATION=+
MEKVFNSRNDVTGAEKIINFPAAMFKIVSYSKLFEDFNEFVRSVRDAHVRKEIEDRDRKLAYDADKMKK